MTYRGDDLCVYGMHWLLQRQLEEQQHSINPPKLLSKRGQALAF
jgi:hypothetical protein